MITNLKISHKFFVWYLKNWNQLNPYTLSIGYIWYGYGCIYNMIYKKRNWISEYVLNSIFLNFKNKLKKNQPINYHPKKLKFKISVDSNYPLNPSHDKKKRKITQ